MQQLESHTLSDFAHPFSLEFRDMTEEEYTQLVEDIAAHGLHEPIVMYEDLILDGRHRYRALHDLHERGMAPRVPDPVFTDFAGSREEARAYVLSMNLHRRHLTQTERACQANDWIDEQLSRPPGRPKKNGTTVVPFPPGRAREIAAAQHGVSTQLITYVGEIKKTAPDLFDVVKQGGMTLRDAQKEVKVRQQQEAQEERERQAAEIKADPRLILGDFREAGAQIADETIDLIFTDPPYAENAVQLYGELGRFASRVLKPGGICLTYSGNAFLPGVLNALSENLTYGWICAIRHTGGELRFRNLHIRNAWKPMPLFYKPPLTLWWDWFSDLTSGGKEKDEHEWQQAEAEAAHFIQALCPQGGSVCDPFAGSGTSLIAAKRHDLRYVGFEVDADTYNQAQVRLSEI